MSGVGVHPPPDSKARLWTDTDRQAALRVLMASRVGVMCARAGDWGRERGRESGMWMVMVIECRLWQDTQTGHSPNRHIANADGEYYLKRERERERKRSDVKPAWVKQVGAHSHNCSVNELSKVAETEKKTGRRAKPDEHSPRAARAQS